MLTQAWQAVHDRCYNRGKPLGTCRAIILPSDDRMNRFGRLSLLSLAISLIVAVAFGAGYVVAHRAPIAAVSAETPEDMQSDFAVFWEVWNHVRTDFVDQTRVQPGPLTQGAIRGMLAALEDKHTVYIAPDQYRREKEDLKGSFEGIGAHVAMDGDYVTIERPIEGSPAIKAGIRAGDKILKIDGEDAKGMALEEAVKRIRGPKGTPVVLTILHTGESDPVDIVIVRGEIETPSVTLKEAEPDIPHLIIRGFGQRTHEEVSKALQDPLVRNGKGLILDLRHNPGGLLDATVKTAGEFLEEGQILAQEDGKGNVKVWNDEPGGLATQIPIIVLVNGGSASGSEVLAGALRDHGRATIIGEKTFGKGSVNHIYELSDQGAVYITFARWRTPGGTLIEGQGLTPDIEVPLTPEFEKAEGDVQLKRAIEELGRLARH